MRKFLVLLILLVSVRTFCNISVIYPNGGESFKRGEKVNVLWSDDSGSEYVQINYSDSTGTIIVTFNAENTGSYEWTVPSHTYGNIFKIIVESKVEGSDWDASDGYFSIEKGSIFITSPVAGEVIEMCELRTITYDEVLPEYVYIKLYKNTDLIRRFTSLSDGNYTWNFYTNDLVAGDDYKLRIESQEFSDIYDETGYFTIKGYNNLKGSISGVLNEANSPYILTDSSEVKPTEALIIESGVKLKSAQKDGVLNIYGKINSQGTYNSPVIIENVNISLMNEYEPDSSKIEYTDFKQTYNTNYFENKRTFGGTGFDEGRYVEETSDGGYIIAGSTNSFGSGSYDVWLIKTDSNGNRLWDRTYGGSASDYGYCVKQIKDGFIITGYTESFGAGSDDILLIKTDNLGNEIWTKTFGGTERDRGNSLVEAGDGGYVITGYTESFGAGSKDIVLVKTDSDGNQLWYKTYGGELSDHAVNLAKTSDGGYLLAGSLGVTGDLYNYTQMYFLKVDVTGNEEWSKTYGELDTRQYGYSAFQASDGCCYLAGWFDLPGIWPPPDYQSWIIKIDALGNEIWNNKYEGSLFSATLSPDDGIILVGINWIETKDSNDILLQKINKEGTVEWNKMFGGETEDYGYSVIEAENNTYVFAGSTSSYGSGSYDAWLIKTDSFGNEVFGDQKILINDNSKIIIQNCKIQNMNDYGIIVNNASPVISNNLITGNKGGIKLSGSSTHFIVNNTIADNDSIGIWFEGNSDVSCINNIIYGNGIYQVFLADDESDPSFYYNDIQGGLATFGTGWGVIYSGSYENNIDADPLFIDSGYEIFVNSPCFNSGMPDLDENDLIEMNMPLYDIAGNQRIRLDRIDIGSFETYEVGIENNNMPLITELRQNYPNPFNPSTEINYSLKSEGMVTLSVFNTKGELVSSLVNGMKTAGNHSVNFNGEGLNSGIYFYKLSVDSKPVQSRKMMMLK